VALLAAARLAVNSRGQIMATTCTDESHSSLDYKIVGTLLLFLLLAAKAYGVGGFSLTTAGELIAVTPLTVFFGTVALYTYAIMAFVFIWSIWLMIAGIRGNKTYRRLVPLLLVLAIFSGFLTPLPYLVLAVLGAIISIGISRLLRTPMFKHIGKKLTGSCASPGRTDTAKAVAGVMLSLFVLLTIRTPWVPAEVVNLTTPVTVPTTRSSQVYDPVAFVMNDSNGWATLLLDDDRHLVWVRDSDIKQRRICHLYSQLPGVEPSFDTILRRPYSPHNKECFKLTDDPLEKVKRPPLPSWIQDFLTATIKPAVIAVWFFKVATGKW
jgi:hypothetical protein